MKLIVCLFLLCSFSAHSETISMRSDEWCPYACDPKSSKPGFMVEIAKEAFAKYGHKVNYEVMNWPRALVEVKNGKYNAVIGASRSDVEGFVIPQIPTGVLINYYWTLKENKWEYKGESSLKGIKVGVINNYSYGDEIDHLVKGKHLSFKEVSGESPLLRLIQMTESKRLDAFVENPFVLEYNLNKLKKNKSLFKVASPNIANDSNLFIAFSPANPKSKEYARLLDRGVVELRKSGRLKAILAKYGFSDWEN